MALPEHKTEILKNNWGFYIVRCSLCGQVGKQYEYYVVANSRKKAHDSGQDTGSGS